MEYVIHIKNLKQELNHGSVLKKVHWVIKCNQRVWLKPYIVMNTDLRKKSNTTLRKTFSNWWIIQFLEKTCKMFKNIGTLNL